MGSTLMTIRPSRRLYLMALDSRFSSTCLSRRRSARTKQLAVCWSDSMSISIPRAAASGRIRPIDSLINSAMCTASGDSSSRSDSMPAMSSTSLIMASRCLPPRRMWPTASSCDGVRPSISSSCAKPSTALSGVRSSWLIRDRNSSFAALARSASSWALRAVASAFLRSVMSVMVPATRIGPSSVVVTGSLVCRIQRISPSGRMIRSSTWVELFRSAPAVTAADSSRSSGWMIDRMSGMVGLGMSGSNARIRNRPAFM